MVLIDFVCMGNYTIYSFEKLILSLSLIGMVRLLYKEGGWYGLAHVFAHFAVETVKILLLTVILSKKAKETAI